MKKILIILLSIVSLTGLSVQAQTKKAATVKKKATTAASTKKASTVTPNKVTAPVNDVVVTKEKATVPASNNQPFKQSKAVNEPIGYKTAVGLKFIYGVSLTGKFFLKEKHALEAIVRYNGAGGEGTNIAFTALYEYHGSITSVEGLRWYLGGGGYVNHFSYKNSDAPSVNTFGIAGVVGLEYKIKGLPLAISADWLPGYVVSNSLGFSAENGGIGVKYTF